MDCELKNKGRNLEKAISLIEKAAEQKVDLICFPELFTTGYHFGMIKDDFYKLAENIDGPLIDILIKKSKENNIIIVAPMAIKSSIPGLIYNGAVVIDKKGDVKGTYSKVHLWDIERDYFRSGWEYPVFEVEFGRFAVMICYDCMFPEVSRIFALKGAELILCPSAWTTSDKHTWDISLKARAIDNYCYVAGINRIGEEAELNFFGNNLIINPKGQIEKEGGTNTEEIVITDIDLNNVVTGRRILSCLKDRKVNTYGEVMMEY